MGKQFIEDELHTEQDHHINSLIMGQADDIATQLTELECKIANIKCYKRTLEGTTEVIMFTEEAQDIFDIHYDNYKTDLYKLFNKQLSIIQ